MSETTEGQDGEEGVDAKDAESSSVIDSFRCPLHTHSVEC